MKKLIITISTLINLWTGSFVLGVVNITNDTNKHIQVEYTYITPIPPFTFTSSRIQVGPRDQVNNFSDHICAGFPCFKTGYKTYILQDDKWVNTFDGPVPQALHRGIYGSHHVIVRDDGKEASLLDIRNAGPLRIETYEVPLVNQLK